MASRADGGKYTVYIERGINDYKYFISTIYAELGNTIYYAHAALDNTIYDAHEVLDYTIPTSENVKNIWIISSLSKASIDAVEQGTPDERHTP